MTLKVATVDEQRMASIEEGFNLRQQWNVAQGVFLVSKIAGTFLLIYCAWQLISQRITARQSAQANDRATL